MKRRVKLFMVVTALAPLGVALGVASTAWACAALATIKMDSRVVTPGQEVTVTGRGFSDTHAGSVVGDSPVALRLKTRRGKVLQEVHAQAGRIETLVTIPETMSPGYYVMIATQSDASGRDKAGTPARYAFRVTGARAAQSAAASPWSSAPGGPPSGPSISVPVAGDLNGQTLLAGGMLTVFLLAAGTVLVGRRRQTLRSGG